MKHRMAKYFCCMLQLYCMFYTACLTFHFLMCTKWNAGLLDAPSMCDVMSQSELTTEALQRQIKIENCQT